MAKLFYQGHGSFRLTAADERWDAPNKLIIEPNEEITL